MRLICLMKFMNFLKKKLNINKFSLIVVEPDNPGKFSVIIPKNTGSNNIVLEIDVNGPPGGGAGCGFVDIGGGLKRWVCM